MIVVRRQDLAAAAADVEAVVRPVRSDGEALTAVGRRLEVAAGPDVVARLREMGDLPVGGALLTPGGDLASSFLVHVVVQAPDEPVTEAGVRRGLVNALRRASELGIASLALAPLGVGAGNLDAEAAARIMEEVVGEHRDSGEPPRTLVIVVESDYEERIFGRLASGEERPAAGT